ncbi:MAG: zinc ribbon domain-containing protein [Clostridiaceae bacterium]|nr:zinc ribbon domain-containing protein [Clostridiaceae bacterium]
MFCSGCGKEVPDESTKCPECGKVFEAADSDNKETVASEKNTSNLEIGKFLMDFIKNPAEAVSARTEENYWIWGLISLGAFALVYFFRFAFDSEVDDFGVSFALFFTVICALAALIISLYYMQNAFKIQKKSFKAVLAAVGLSMIPMVPLIIISSLFDYIILGDNSIMNVFLNPMLGLGYILSALILVSFFSEGDDHTSVKGLRLVMTGYLIFTFVFSLFGALIWYQAL